MTATTDDAMYTLYYYPGGASMVIHLLLIELDVPFQLQLVDLEAGAQRDPHYLKLNPQGVVPTLIVDGRPLAETAALLMVLADRHPASPLAPPVGSAQREAWYQWLVLMSNNLMATYRYWFYPGDMGLTTHPPEVQAALQARISSVWTRLDAELAARGPYLLGDQISSADLLLTMLMRWSREMPTSAMEWPSLRRLADLVRSRDSWKRMMATEGLEEF